MSSAVDAFASRLADSSSDFKAKLNVATELREAVEVHQVAPDHDGFMSTLLPELLKLLETVPVSMHALSPEHKLRYCLLDVLIRLKPNEALKPAVPSILKRLMTIIDRDNEENGVISLKVITNMHRAYTTQLEEFVQPFFDLVIKINGNMPSLVQELFGSSSPNSGSGGGGSTTPGATAASPADASGSALDRPLLPAMRSFKVLTECPIIVVCMYSTNRSLIVRTLPMFISHLIETLSLEAAPQAKEHAAAQAKGEHFCGVAPVIRMGPHRQAFSDFVMAQIKITSFLAYALRAYTGALHQHYTLVPNFVVRLLKDCPPEMSAARKELLVSMRHILSTDFRTFFIAKVSTLLDERVLIGSGLTASENLRPLAYSTMADLIHHVRNELSTAQIWQTVHVFTRNLQDNSLATSFQIMSAKLLLNFLDRVTSMQERTESRQILVVILKAFVDRFISLNRDYLEQSEIYRRKKPKRAATDEKPSDTDKDSSMQIEGNAEAEAADIPVITAESDLTLQQALQKIVILKIHSELPNTELKDARYVFKNLVLFLKNLVYGLKSTNPPATAQTQWGEVARSFSFDDVTLLKRLLRETLRGMALFANGTGEPDDTEKELMEAVITVFVHLDPPTFHEVLAGEMPFLIEELGRNPSLLHFTQLLAGNETTSPNFCGIALRILMKRLDQVGSGDVIVPRLFRQCFAAVNLFPTVNESVILPHLRDLVVESLELARKTDHPERCFGLLQQLFRNLGGGRFDSVYKQVLSLLQVLLETLNKRLSAARTPDERNMYADLCLTVPVRLSLLVPHLSWLMKPLVQALGPEAPPELVAQGLRTLELCVDNLTVAWFDPVIEPVLPDVMAALWSHLQPLPYDHKLSHTTLRVLGKLGGRSRAFLSTAPIDLKPMSTLNQDTTVVLNFGDINSPVRLRISPPVRAALRIVHHPLADATSRVASYKLLVSVLLRYIPTTDEAVLTRENVESVNADPERATALPDGSGSDLDARARSEGLCEDLLKGIMVAAGTLPEVEKEADTLLVNIVEHLVLLELGEYSVERRRALGPFSLSNREGELHVTPRTLVAAVVFALAHPSTKVQEVGKETMRRIWQAGKVLCTSGEESFRYPMMRGLFGKLSHSCFEAQWYIKSGAVRGLRVLVSEFNFAQEWLAARQVELTRTLFFVIKDSSSSADAPNALVSEATDLLLDVIRGAGCPNPDEKPFSLLTSLLAYEIESASCACRETSQRALHIVSEMSGLSLNEILSRVTDVFLTPIFMKPLRALPFPMQIGYIDAVSFCLALPDSFMVFNDKLMRLLDEAWALVDAEDESLTSAHRVLELSTSQQLSELRVVCIKLLALAATSTDHLATTHPAMRAKIIAVFFKTLSSPSEPAVSAAHDALRRVLQQTPRMPKDLLQNGLRPILVNLSDHRRLTPTCLGGLARLLELLTYYFKVEIGKKLLDHLKAWTDPATLGPIAGRDLESDDRVKIGVAILNVFHLLPPTAYMFIPVIVESLIEVESTLRRVHDSPFRAPVAQFLDRHASQTFDYFADRLQDLTHGRLFADFTRRAPHLRDHVREHIGELSSRISGFEREDEQCIGVCNFVFVLKAAGDNDVAWYSSERATLLNVISSVGDILRAVESQPDKSPLHLTVEFALEALQDVILASEPDNELLLLLVSSLTQAGARIGASVQDWFYKNIALAKEPPLNYLEKALESVSLPQQTLNGKHWVMSSILLVLVVQIHREKSLEHMSGAWLRITHEKIWQQARDDAQIASLDRYHVQTLEMAMLLVVHAVKLVGDARKDVIKYGWAFFKVDDIVSKLSASVLVAQFIAVFETFPKIVTQIYASLLKTSQAEAKSLVQQGLDILGGVLQQRIQSALWAKWPRRVLGEDGHVVTNVASVCLFLCRHAELFYPYREVYEPYFVSAIVKLSYVPSATLDVDLAELLAKWAEMRDAAGPEGGYSIPQNMRETVMTYLVRFVCTQNQRVRDTPNGTRVLAALDKLLTVWDVEVKLEFFDRTLVQADLANATALTQALNALEVVYLALLHHRAATTPQNIVTLLEKVLALNSLEVHKRLVLVLEVALPQAEELQQVTLSALQEHLSAPSPSQPIWVLLAREITRVQPAALDPMLPQIIKALSRLVKEVVEDNAGDIPMLLLALDVVASRISHLGDQRRAFLTLIAQLIERGSGAQLAIHILNMVRQWVFSHAELFPTTKEKAAILHKLLAYRDRPDLAREYFGIIIGIFEDEEIRKSELPARLEQPFLVGTAQSDENTRNKLLDILASTIEPTVYRRLMYVFAEQSWEALADRQWLSQALALVLGVLTKLDAPLVLQPSYAFAPVSILCHKLAPESRHGSVTDVNTDNEAIEEPTKENPEDVAAGVKSDIGGEAMVVDEQSVVEDEGETAAGDMEAAETDAAAIMELDAPAGSASPSSQPQDELDEFLARRRAFLLSVSALPASNFVEPFRQLMFADRDVVHQAWIDMLQGLYRTMSPKECTDTTRALAGLLARDYHLRQADVRPNVVQTLLSALARTDSVPPQLARYLAINYDAWYPAIEACERVRDSTLAAKSPKVVDAASDALAELYAALGDNDVFYGLWRTRSRYKITSAALSFEQCGMWSRAMLLHETAQIKARSGVLPFDDSEYTLWEDHWVLCAEKLQHWDVLTDIAKHEGFSDLLLECGWRQADWFTEREALEQTVKSLMDQPTPRRQVFETFMVLQGFAQKTESLQRLSQCCDEGIQLALRKWHALPSRIVPAHISLLHTFQQYVEFMEASQVYTSLSATTAMNLETKSNELKGVLSAWHDRLPNLWDDINLWGDLATWRQHVFNVINRVYLPLIPQLQPPNGSNSAAYRGYHEIAWMINRFAHVARKHNLPDVCVNLLSRIYQLPNIEIQEAFLKLREQAKCHLQNPAELQTGLEVISNTNLAYFGNAQKSEFFALKGMSLARLGAEDHANEAFSTAVQNDVYLPKAWAEWGAFNDRRFKAHPDHMEYGSAATVCYLHAAGLYKNAKCRKLLGRLLWLLSLDDAQGTLAGAFDNFQGDTPTWYWVTYIPQLLTALSQREARIAARLLSKIAKMYPQALHFHLRTAREEYVMLQRVSQRRAAAAASSGTGSNVSTEQSEKQPISADAGKFASVDGNSSAASDAVQHDSPSLRLEGADEQGGSRNSESRNENDTSTVGVPSDVSAKDRVEFNSETNNSSGTSERLDNSSSSSVPPGNDADRQGAPQRTQSVPSPSPLGAGDRPPWEYIEEIMSILKTSYPLLALSLETLIDQMYHRFKSPPDEDAYRLIVALLNDALTYLGRQQCPRENLKLPPQTEANVSRFAEGVIPATLRPSFENDFVHSRPNLDTYIRRLRVWRDRLEAKLDARPPRVNLESLSPPLSEFHYQKFEEVEIPGQNMEIKDSNSHSLKIARFLPHVDNVRAFGISYRRITIEATDGSRHAFAIQWPAARHCRREERMTQVFKILNSVMQQRSEARKRGLQFTLPVAVPLNTHIRFVQDDPHYKSFYQIYERFCRQRGQSRDAPFDYTVSKIREAFDPRLPKPDLPSVKMEIMTGIQTTLVPPTIMLDFFLAEYQSFEDFWLFRRQFAYQYAGVTFMTIMMSVNNRYPHKFLVNLQSGAVWATEMLPILPVNRTQPTFLNGEPVAFRLTPNLQTLLGPTMMEGIFSMAIMIIAKGLTEPEFDLASYLPLFVRDELISAYPQQRRLPPQQAREIVRINVDAITRRASSLAQIGSGTIPANQTVIDLVSLAVNPRNLVLTEILWMPYY